MMFLSYCCCCFCCCCKQSNHCRQYSPTLLVRYPQWYPQGPPYAETGSSYPENDGYLFGGFPEIPGVIGGDGAQFGDGVGVYEENDQTNGNEEVRERQS